MTDREQQGREYVSDVVSDVVGQPWAEIAAALNKLELDPKRLDNSVFREAGRRAWEAHAEQHRRAAEWWARNRPGAVVDPGTTRHLDGVTTRCLLRGSCGASCYCARTLWQLGRRPVEPVLAGELTGSEAWKAGAAVTYVNEALVREEMAKGPVRVMLAPEVAAAVRRTNEVVDQFVKSTAAQVARALEPIGRALAYEHVVGPVHPYFHEPDHSGHFHRSEYFNQVIDPDAGPGTEPCG